MQNLKFLRLTSGLLLSSALTVSTARASVPEAIGFGGSMPDLGAVQVESGHVYDYTFTSAPVDWKVQSGVWEMTNRWSCSPGWSWFGGRSEEIAAIWNKRKFSGDFSAQFYFAFKMGLTGTQKWMERPADAALTVCGDGKNVASGYSLILAANDNQHCVLLKNGKPVAESSAPEAILVSNIDGRVDDSQLHRKWWYAKINKIGNRIECWLDNKLLFTYDDPQPLDVGQLALWTYNNGIMLSRVQVFYENEVKSDLKTLRINAPVKTRPATPAKVASTRINAPVKTRPATPAKVASTIRTSVMR